VAQGYLTVDGKKCNCNLASAGNIRKDAAMPKKRSFGGPGAEMYAMPTGYESYDYTGATAGATDKRQRVDTMMPNPGYVAIPVDMSQSYQTQLNSSISVIYNDIQNLKYEISNMSQSIAPMISSIMAMKNGIDALCVKQGIVVSSTSTTSNQPH